MTLREQKITKFLRTRWFTFMVITVSFISAFFPNESLPEPLTLTDHGTLFPSPSKWISDIALTRWVALAANLGVVLIMVYINKRFNLLRTMSLVFVAMFMVMESATPAALMWFSGGQLAALAITCCLGAMYSVYNNHGMTRRVFLVFCLLGACSLTQVGFPVYVAVFLTGCAQMRVFSLKTLVGALLGFVTPAWIVFGLGIASPDQLHIPEMANPFGRDNLMVALQLFVTVAVTIIAGVLTGLANLLRIMSMNARTRAYSGLLGIIGVVTGLMAMVDFTNIEFYIPLLNVCTAFQLGYFFRFYSSQRAYIVILGLLIFYAAMWIWKIML